MASTTSVLPQFKPMTAAADAAPRPRASKLAIDARSAIALWRRKRAVVIDLRDWESVDRLGWIQGSMHCPPGEFANLIDPTSALHGRLFQPGSTFIFYGGPKAGPLAAARRARQLGLRDAVALRGGLRAWRNAGGRVVGHPESAFPALKASFNFAMTYTAARTRALLARITPGRTGQPR